MYNKDTDEISALAIAAILTSKLAQPK